MQERDEDEIENDELLEDVFDDELEEDTPLLCKYIDVFLRYKSIADERQDAERVLLYRGQPNKDYLLMPSVFRKNLLHKEHTLIHELLTKAPEGFSNNPIERLIKMQHYGLPTRLLDFSTNPLIALYFACVSNKNEQDKDGEIIVLYDYLQRYDSREVQTISALSEYRGSKAKAMVEFLKNVSISYEYDPFTESSFELEKTVRERHFIPVAAPLNNERIKRQHGALVLFGVCGYDNENVFQKDVFDIKPFLLADQVLIDNLSSEEVKSFGISMSIIVPKDEKSVLLAELDAIGINKSFLFPELEHQASYIKHRYEE